MSFAIAVRIAGSSVRSIAGRAGHGAAASGSPRPRPSRRSPSRRCRAPAACRPPRSGARRAAAAAASSSAPSVERLRAQLRHLVRLHQHRAPHVVDDGARGRPRARPGRGRGSSTRPASCTVPVGAALEQAAVVEEDVHQLPQHVVEGLDQLLARRTGRRSAARTSHSASACGTEADRQAAAPPAPSGPRPRRRRRRSRCRRARRSAPCPTHRRQPDRRQRALADDHGMDELDRDVAHVGARRGRAAERDQAPAARETLRHAVAQPRDPLGLALEEAPRWPACGARSAPRRAPTRRPGVMPAPRRARRPAPATRAIPPLPRRCAR